MSTLLVENIRHEDAASPAITLLSNGNVGIGTNSSDEKLEISNTSGKTVVKTSVAANSTVGLEIEKTGSTTQSWLIADGVTANGKLEFYNTTDSRSIMTMINTGYVGIGSASPDAPLYIDGSVYSSPYGGLRVVGAGSGAGTSNVDLIADFGIGTSGSVSGVWLGGRSDETTGVIGAKTASGNLAFEVYQSGWKERMRINNNGNVGIGTDNPSNKLEIHHNDGYEFALKFNQGNNNIISGFGQQQSILAYATQGNGDAQEYYAGITFGLWDGLTGSKDGTIHFHTANDGVITNNLMIDGDGKIGISQSNPQYQLDITRSGGNTDVARVKGNVGNAFIRFQDNDNSSDFTLGGDDGGPTGSGSFIIYDRNASSYRWRLDSAGRVTMPYQPCAFAFKSGFGNSTSDSGAGALNAVGTNVGGHFNTSTGRFTAPVAGNYHVCWTMMNNQGNTGTAVCILRINDVGYKYFHVENSHPQGQSDQAIVTLSAGDWLDISLSHYHWNGGSQFKYPSMSVFLIG